MRFRAICCAWTLLGATIGLASVALAQGDPAVQVTTLVPELRGAVGGVAVDRVGAIYVADFGSTVWKISPEGEVRVLADSLYGSSGNAVDAHGNLLQANFFADTVSRIDREGRVSTFAEGFRGPVGLAIDDAQNLFVCNCRGNTLSKVTPEGRVSEFAASELFNCPNGIARDAEGVLYVVNFSDGKVLRVDGKGQVSLLAELPGGGNGHVAFALGELFVTGFRSNRIYRVGLDGSVSVLAGTGRFASADGSGADATFSTPNGIAFDSRRDALYTNDYTVPFLQRNRAPARSVLRKIAFPTLTEGFLGALSGEGLDAARQTYRRYRQTRPGRYTEIETNVLGYTLLQRGQVEEAVAVFELNAEDYPNSWNAWDSLAEGHKVAGRREQAIRFYKKSLELNPANANAVQVLRELEAD